MNWSKSAKSASFSMHQPEEPYKYENEAKLKPTHLLCKGKKLCKQNRLLTDRRRLSFQLIVTKFQDWLGMYLSFL